MLTPQNEPFRHRKRTRRAPQMNKTDMISYTHQRWAMLEEKVLLEIKDKEQNAVSLTCMKHGLNPTDFCDKWIKLLRTIDGPELLSLLHRCKIAFKSGLSFPDIGKLVKLRRGSVKNILKGHVNMDQMVCPRASSSVGVPDCFDLVSFGRVQVMETGSKENVVQQFAHFRDLQLEGWLDERGKGLVPRGKQVILLREIAEFGIERAEEACELLGIPETLYMQMWKPLIETYGPSHLEVMAKVVIQLVLMGYSSSTITYKLGLQETFVQDICFNFTLQDTDSEKLLTSFFQLLATEPDLKTLCEECNLPYASAQRLRERWRLTIEVGSAVQDKRVWWLYQNGIDVGEIERWTGEQLGEVLGI